MPMMENRVKYVIFIFIFIICIMFTEYVFSGQTTDISETTNVLGDMKKREGNYTYDPNMSTPLAQNIDFFNPIMVVAGFFIVGDSIEGMPSMLILMFSIIQGLLLGIVIYIGITVILDAAPFTGG